MSWTRFFRRKKWDEERTRELAAHVEVETQENIARGMSLDEARYAAQRKLGNATLIREEIYRMNSIGFLETLWQDMRFAVRMLRKNPGFSAVSILTLALGIGANTAIFSLIDALLLRSLPVRDPQELVMLKWSANSSPQYDSVRGDGSCRGKFGGENPTGCSFSYPFFDELRSRSDVFSSVAASGGWIQLALSRIGQASVIRGIVVSGNYFDTFGVRAAVGRMIEPSDEEPSSLPVTVLSYGYWKRAFGGSLSVVGKTVGLNGVPTTIVGVAEQKFTGLTPGTKPDAWVPLSLRSRVSPGWHSTDDAEDSVWLLIIGRLKPKIQLKEAEAAVSLLFRNDMLYGPRPLSKEADEPRVSLVPAQTGLVGARGTYSTPLLILMIAVAIVLLIASANVAGLLLARSAVRQREMTLRLALGAGRWRIIRQLLTESILLSVLGGALGILFAIWGAHAIVIFVASGSTQSLGLDTSIDIRVLLFTAGISLLTGILCGLAPAMRGMKLDLNDSLKQGAHSSPLRSHAKIYWLSVGNSLVVVQIALTMVVLVGAGLVVRTLQSLRNVDPGFDVSNILNFSIAPTLVGYKGTRMDTLYRDLQSRLSAIPGVTSASYSNSVLLSGDRSSTRFHLAGAPGNSQVDSDYLQVGPNFLATMGISIVRGRDFTHEDFDLASNSEIASAPTSNPTANSGAHQSSSPQPAVVNQTFVRRCFGNVNPLGKRFGNADGGHGDLGYVIVGVVGDAKYDSLRGDINPTTYVPAMGGGVSFELRTSTNPTSIIPAVQSAVDQMDRNLPIFEVATESQVIDQLLFQERLIARLSSLFGILALILACVGLYGLLSYEVTRRTREIGIRMALGAQSGNVLRGVIMQGIALATVGVVIGVGAAIAVTRYLGSILFDVHPGDPITQLAVGALLLTVAFVACFIPARRATRVDPMVALRNE